MMSNFVKNWHFFKNTYGEPYIVRLVFSVAVPADYDLVADNMCKCDHWFSREGNVIIKYDIIENHDVNRDHEGIFEKSIIVDLHAPYSSFSKIELTVSDGKDRIDHFTMMVSDAPDDSLVKR